MIARVVRYRIQDEVQATVEDAIRDFVAAIARAEPNTEYRAYRLAGGREYLHLMAFADSTAEEKHRQAEHTEGFVKVLSPNCEGEPIFTDVTLLASTG